jgi:hypothetical protein
MAGRTACRLGAILRRARCILCPIGFISEISGINVCIIFSPSGKTAAILGASSEDYDCVLVVVFDAFNTFKECSALTKEPGLQLQMLSGEKAFKYTCSELIVKYTTETFHDESAS